jgi:hypothetical protein
VEAAELSENEKQPQDEAKIAKPVDNKGLFARIRGDCFS